MSIWEGLFSFVNFINKHYKSSYIGGLKKVVSTPSVVISSPKTMADEDENNNEKVKKFGAHSVAPKIPEDL